MHESPPPELAELLYRPGLPVDAAPSIEWALGVAKASGWPMPRNVVPLLPVDDQSFACVVAAPEEAPDLPGAGAVVRWHLGVTKQEHQATLLDTAADLYADSVVDELRARPIGLARMLDEIGPAFELSYLDRERRPRDFVVRPVRLACQNVIVGLAAFAHDSAIDGMSVVAWQTCEVPHVSTHEGNRALAALMLCDAFQSGGTMEIRFDRPASVRAEGRTKAGRQINVSARYAGHPELRVPASLRRYGRTVGSELGAEDRGCISPSEARDLFLAVTPMPEGLSIRVRRAVEENVATPERICFTLLSQIWREIELDYLLAVSSRTGSILQGGASWTNRPERQAESHVARAALIAGMLFRRLDTRDHAAESADARVLEDSRVGVSWHIDPDLGAITYIGLRPEPAPWHAGSLPMQADRPLVALPRASVSRKDIEVARLLRNRGLVALVVPADARVPEDDTDGVVILRCPDRTGELDQEIEQRLLRARTARA